MRRFACVSVFLGAFIGHSPAEAEFRLNPFAADDRVAELPAPLVQPPTDANGVVPKMKVPQFSMPTMSLPTMKLPELKNPLASSGDGPKLSMPKLPDLRPTGEIFQQIDRGRQKLWNSAKAPFQDKSAQKKFLPSVRPVGFQTPSLSLPKLKSPVAPAVSTAPADEPQTITGWLSQPRPE